MKNSWPAIICMAIALLLIILTVICNGCYVTVNKETNIFIVNPIVEVELTLEVLKGT